MILDIVHGVVLLALAAVASYTDLKEGKVRNNHLAFFIIVLLGLQLYRYSSGKLTLWFYAINVFLTIGFAFVLWLEEVIPAGDSKLLMVFGAGLPLQWYSSYAPTIFPMSLVFTLSFIVPLLQSLGQCLVRRNFPKIKLQPQLFLTSYIAYAFLLFLMRMLGLAGIQVAGIFMLIAYIFLLKYLMKKFTSVVSYKWIVAIVLTLVNLIFYDAARYVIESFAFSILLVAGIQIVEALFRKAFTVVVPAGKLRPGMVLADIIVKDKGKYKALPNLYGVQVEALFTCDAEGIEWEDIEELKGYLKEYRVFQEIPLAPYISAGVIILILLSL